MAIASASFGSAFPMSARGSAIAVAANAMHVVSGRVDADASTLARSGPDVSTMVDLDVQRDSFDALATVVHASDGMLGSVLDILA
jgi:hypothetical protein